MEHLVLTVFGGDYPPAQLALHQIAARSAVLYLVGLAIVRIGKSRMLSGATPLDVVMGFILGSILARGMTGNASLSGSTVSATVLVSLHWLLSAIAYRSHFVGTLIKGNANLVVQDGQPRTEMLQASFITQHDLEEHLRLRGIASLEDVQQAYKERNGEISVIPRKKPPRVLEIAVQPGVQTVRIQLE